MLSPAVIIVLGARTCQHHQVLSDLSVVVLLNHMPTRQNVASGALVTHQTVLEVEELSALAFLGLAAIIVLRAAHLHCRFGGGSLLLVLACCQPCCRTTL